MNATQAVKYMSGKDAELAMNVVTGILTNIPGVKIVWHNGTAIDADPFRKVIRIPRVANASMLSQESLMLLRGMVYHEGGHILLTNLPKAEWPKGALMEIWNAVEDRWMERGVRERFAGAKTVLPQMSRHYNTKIAKQITMEGVDAPLWEALCAMGFMGDGIVPAWRLTPKAQLYFDAGYNTFIKWKACKSSKGTFKVAQELYDLLKEVHESTKPQPQSDEESTDEDSDEQVQGQGQSQQQEQQEQGEEDGEPQQGGTKDFDDYENEQPEKGGASDDSDDDEEGTEEGDEEQGSGSDSEEGDEEDEEESDDDSQGSGSEFDEEGSESDSEGDDDEDDEEGQSDSESDSDDEEGDSEASSEGDDSDEDEAGDENGGSEDDGRQGGNYNPSEEEDAEDDTEAEVEEYEDDEPDWEEIAQRELDAKALNESMNEDLAYVLADTINDPNVYTARRDKDVHDIPNGNKAAYLSERKEVSGKIMSLCRALDQSLRVLSKSRIHSGLRRGTLDNRRLVHAATGISKNVFYKTTKGITLDTVVSIVIDESGSMDNIHEVRRMVIAMGEALTKIGVDFEVVGTTTRYWADDALLRNMDGFDRTNPIIYRHYKMFGESWNQVAQRTTAMQASKHNVDGEAVEYASYRLASRKETRKVIFSICDGEPFAGHRNEAVMQRNLRDVCKRVRQQGIEVYSISIDTDGPASLYGKKNCIIVSSADGIDAKAAKFFSDTLMKGVESGK